MIETIDCARHDKRISDHFGDHEYLGALLHCLGLPVRSDRYAWHVGRLTATSENILANERLFAATQGLMRITAPPAEGYQRLIVVRGHPGGLAPYLCVELERALAFSGVDDVAITSGWTKHLLVPRGGRRFASTLRSLLSIERQILRAHSLSRELAWHLLGFHQVVLVWDPLADTSIVTDICEEAGGIIEAFLVEPASFLSIQCAIDALVDGQDEFPVLGQIPPHLASLLVPLLHTSKSSYTMCKVQ